MRTSLQQKKIHVIWLLVIKRFYYTMASKFIFTQQYNQDLNVCDDDILTQLRLLGHYPSTVSNLKMFQ
jgi:hypothetical protein